MGPAERSHPGRDELERFMSGRLGRCEARAVVRHLLAGCPQCMQVTCRLWNLGDRVPRTAEPVREPLHIVGLKG